MTSQPPWQIALIRVVVNDIHPNTIKNLKKKT